MFTYLTDQLIVRVSTSLYNEAVIYKCFYWYTAHYPVTITLKDDQWVVSIIIDSAGAALLQPKIQQDIIDFKLRDIVNTETKVIRELLIAKAFVHEGAQPDPDSSVTDPVGFNPSDVP